LSELIRIKCENQGVVITATHGNLKLHQASTITLTDFTYEQAITTD